MADWDVTGNQVSTPGKAGVLREVAYAPGRVNHPVRLKDAAGAKFHYHFNPLGSVVALTPATGGGVEQVRYEAYGRPTFVPTDGLAPTGNPYLFTGQRRCFATGNYYYRARYYDPNLGRFLSRDPLGAWGDSRNHGGVYACVGTW